MIYLDLEGTIIKSWHNPVFINIRKIRKYLRENNVKEIGIYSFAIYDDADRNEFNASMKDSIENLLNVKVIKVLTVDEIQKIICSSDNMHNFLTMDLGKYLSFLKYCMVKHKGRVATLIDDAVPDSKVFVWGWVF